MKKISFSLILIVLSFASFGQILQDPSTTPSTARTNDAISGAYTASGTDAYTISPTGSFSYTWLTDKAVSVTFPPAQANTGAATLNFDGLGVRDIKKYSYGSLVDVSAGDLIGTIRLRYDGTQFVMEGGTGSGGGSQGLQDVLTVDPDLTSSHTIDLGANSLSIGTLGSGISMHLNNDPGSEEGLIVFNDGVKGSAVKALEDLAVIEALDASDESAIRVAPSSIEVDINGDLGTTGEFIGANGSGKLVWATPSATNVTNTPAGTIAATTVQAAINELDNAIQLQPVGTIISETWANLTNWTNEGSGTFSVASNILTINGGTPGAITLTNYRRQSTYGNSNTEDFEMTGTVTVGTVNGTSHGVGFGVQAQGVEGGESLIATIILNSSSEKGKISFYVDGDREAITAGGISITAGDVLNLSLNRNKGRFTFVVENTTTKETINDFYEYSFVYPVSFPDSYLIPNSVNYSIYALGGTHTMASGFTVTNNAFKDIDLSLLADSKNTGYYLVEVKNRVTESINRNYYANVSVNGAPGLKVEELNATEILAQSPNNILILAGYNNVYFGDTPSATITKMNTLISSLTGYTMGVNLFIGTMEASSDFDVTPLNTLIRSTYPTGVIDFYYSSWSGTSYTTAAEFDSGDGIHLNEAWGKIQTGIIASKFGFIAKKPIDNLSSGIITDRTEVTGGNDKRLLYNDGGIVSETIGLEWENATSFLQSTGSDVNGGSFGFQILNNGAGAGSGGASDKYMDFSVLGSTAFGLTALVSTGLIRTATAGGMLLSAYGGGDIKFSRGTSYVVGARLGANGFGVGLGATSPTAKVHMAAGTATASTAPLKFTSGTNLTTPEAGAVEFDGTNYFATSSTTRYTLAKTLTATATLNFGGTPIASLGNEILTITVTGAADGDAVSIGVPNGSMTAGLVFTAWVSAANTVSIQCYNSTLGSIDPASGTFRASVIKY